MQITNKNVQILSIEGKDLLTKKYKVTEDQLYKGSLDDSIEIDQLRKLNRKIIKLNKKKKRFYSNDIITVTFEYACKGNNKPTDEEYDRIDNYEMAIKLLQLQLKQDKKALTIEEKKTITDKINDTKESIKMIKGYINKKEIRMQLYRYGFHININGKTEHFVRYKRSSGSARDGKCLFINKKYYKDMIDWSFAGIPHEENIEMDCASMEAYIALPTSSCISRFKLEPKNILLIKDGTSTFKDTVMATHLINEQKDENGNIIDGDLFTDVEEMEITNKIWDGENLLDKSIFIEAGYEDKAILQIRNRHFKGIGINTDIQQFFKDNNITKVSQLKGKTIATDIRDIKLITTPSSIKYLKSGTFEQWLNYIVPDWGICKYEKEQHHFSKMAQTHYQLINTLGMNKEMVSALLVDTVEYINLLRSNTAVFKFHLGLLSELKDSNGEEELEMSNNIRNSVDFMLNMLTVNDDFINTAMCRRFRTEVVSNYIKNVRRGHILVFGNYSIVISSPLEFLKESIGQWNGESLIQPHECVSSHFEIGEEILGVRSPQPTMCNMTVFKNNKYDEMDKYFNTTSKEVIYISAIGWNIFELESSMDVDGDAMLLTNNKYIVHSAKLLNQNIHINGKTIKRFLVSTDFTPKLTIKRKYGWEDLADTDIKCSSNKIGEIINLAQMLNSVYWDKKYNGASENELFELYKDICQLNILSCIEIDRCKKLSPVNAKKELDKIRKKGYLGKGKITRNKQKKEVGIRPYFFKFLDGGKDYKFKKFHTGMDYLEQILDKQVDKGKSEEDILDFKDVIQKQEARKANRHYVNNILKIVKEMKYKEYKVWHSNSENKWSLCNDIYREAMDKISKIKITPEIIYVIFLRLNKSQNDNNYKDYKKLGRRLLQVLYDSNKKGFMDCIRKSTDTCKEIIEDYSGNIDLYGVKFREMDVKYEQKV